MEMEMEMGMGMWQITFKDAFEGRFLQRSLLLLCGQRCLQVSNKCHCLGRVRLAQEMDEQGVVDGDGQGDGDGDGEYDRISFVK